MITGSRTGFRHAAFVAWTALALQALVPGRAGAADPFAEARELYAAAAYEDSLARLAAVRDEAVQDQVEEYRALCLLALNREGEAAQAIEALVSRHPQPLAGIDQRPPKFVAAYRGVRARIVPGLVTAAYTAGKQAFDAGDYARSVRHLTESLATLTGARAEGTASAEATDLELLVSGFLSLAERRLLDARSAPPAEPEVLMARGAGGLPSLLPPASVVEPSPWPRLPVDGDGFQTALPPAGGDVVPAAAGAEFPLASSSPTRLPPAADPAAADPPALPGPRPAMRALDEPAPFAPVPRVYTAEDADVTPPVVIEERLPAWIPPYEFVRQRRFAGRLEIVIDVDGRVFSADITHASYNPYDDKVLQAVKQWRYQPASKRRVPVQFRRVIDYVLTAAPDKARSR